jgi:hypothetical protein
MFARQLFICSAIKDCQEKVNCCPHKLPHIKDERCVPRECRYALGAEDIDCIKYDPDNPAVPVPAKVAPAKTVEETLKAKIVEQKVTVTVDEATPELLAVLEKIEETGEFVPLDQAAKELGIKDAVKKAATKRPKKTAAKKGKVS